MLSQAGIVKREQIKQKEQEWAKFMKSIADQAYKRAKKNHIGDG